MLMAGSLGGTARAKRIARYETGAHCTSYSSFYLLYLVGNVTP
ncbi:hypothetical protein CGMCC3_g6973 [Colletotrichum fructicola]|nr:uncharacterized protein CGMCC3_g6973 [Colletotrichum fructicola]KAE9577090.1 hypothetical protein CGMCC3_g6973 [Colletotrichum fructicola]